MVNGQTRFCEESFINPTCAAPTPTPSPPNPTNCVWGEAPGTTIWGWMCFCHEGTPANYQANGSSGCPDGPYNDGHDCCQSYTFEGYSGTAWCDIDVPATCRDGVDNDGDHYVDDGDPGCLCPSPVVIDTAGDGFDLTGALDGVLFDIAGTGVPLRLGWTRGDDAWLALDRDGNGRIDDGRELFGNYTPQPDPPAGQKKNGFLALAVYDQPGSGGNADGRIDASDAVFASLRLWLDVNHDGVSQPGELYTLPSLDVARIHLDYKESKREDEHGNRFRYRAKVDDARGAKVNRWAWDVFLVPGR